MNIKYILTHPIQYQSPLIKYLNKKISINVAYRSNISLTKYYDKDFNQKIILNKGLLTGYKYVFLKHFGSNKVTAIKPFTTEYIKNIFSNDTKIIWLHGFAIWYNLIIILIANIFNKKVFVRSELSNSKKKNFLKFIFKKIFYLFIDNFIDCYLSIGTENKKKYLSYGISRNKIFDVPYVVDNDYFYIKKKKKYSKLKILFTGKLIHRKGCDILLKSIDLLNKDIKFKQNSEIIIVGDGEMKSELSKFVKKNNLNNVKFVGFKKQNLIRNYYKNSNVFIMPSREENWGLAINEAMAAKNAIISSNSVVSSKDLVKNNFNGYTFNNQDYLDLAKKILKIYNSKDRGYKLGENSFKIISKWSFKECFLGLTKAKKFVLKKT